MARLTAAERAMMVELAPEARTYAQIIQSTLMRLGEFYAPSIIKPRGKQIGGRHIQKVEFERICLTPEIIYLKVKVHKRGWLGSKSALPHRVRLADLMSDDTARELSHACLRKVTWECDDDNPQKGAWYLIHRNEGMGGIPKHVPFSAMLEHYPADMSIIPFVLGSGPHRKVEMLSLGKTPHLLIAGPTGTGKSNAANAFILAQMFFNAPKDLQFILIDLKEGIEFRDYEDSPHLNRPVVRDVLDGLEVLNELTLEIKHRMSLLSGGAKDWATYRAQHPDQEAPYIIVVIDEYAQFVFAHGPQVASRANAKLIKIAAQGRAVGIQLVVCTQYPTGEVVNRQVRVNLNAAIAFHCMTSAQSVVILNVGDAAELPDVKGRALYTCGPYVHEVQMAYVSPEDTTFILKTCKEKWGTKTFEVAQKAPEPEQVKVLPPEKKIELILADPDEWFNACCKKKTAALTPVSTIYDNYIGWANANHRVPMGKNPLGSWLNEQGFQVHDSNGVRYRRGLKLIKNLKKAQSESAEEAEMAMEMAGDR